ncbi:MAG: hypothetical protein IT174_12920 [Acidobacteria bacterium]|nr:hypothetical protein [Acidobacteriota bacterium]
MNYYNYYTEIEDTFVRRRAKHLLLSPLDWALMEVWQERGIPLHVALRAIESVFDAFDKKPTTRTIKGLMFCREEVEAQYEEWLRSQTGKAEDAAEAAGDGLSPEVVSTHISKLVNELRHLKSVTLSDDIERAATRLEELGQNLGEDFEHIDRSLADIEHFLDNAMLTNSDPEHLKRSEKQTAEQLKPYKASMEKDAYKNTFDLMLLKQLREENGIPRLTLFYL